VAVGVGLLGIGVGVRIIVADVLVTVGVVVAVAATMPVGDAAGDMAYVAVTVGNWPRVAVGVGV